LVNRKIHALRIILKEELLLTENEINRIGYLKVKRGIKGDRDDR